MMNRILKKLVFSCKKASELIDKESVFPLTWAENIQLKVHTSLCKACLEYEKQGHLLDELLDRHHLESNQDEVPQVENQDLKVKIISKL